jgi:capsular polysaccharide biosynthesis protein
VSAGERTSRPGRAGGSPARRPQPANRATATTGLVSLRFIGAALRRRAWVWCTAATAGLLVGLALFVVAPPAYQAESAVLVANDPLIDPATQIQGDVALAQSAQVSDGVMRQLGVREPVATFLASYTITIISDRILQITARAPTQAEAVAEANALATQFLKFRGNELVEQQRLAVAGIVPLVKLRTRQFQSLAKLIAQVASEPRSPAQGSALRHLRVKYRLAGTALGAIEYTLTNYPVVTTSMIEGSQVLDPAAPIPPSRKHLAALGGIAGLLGGLGLGLGTVAIGAVMSDRLRRRDDVAAALGCPVRSIGSTRRRLSARPGLAAARRGPVRRLADQLRVAIPDGRPAALAVVPVDNTRAVSLALVHLAVSFAQDGRRVVLADLSDRARMARILGAAEPGVHVVEASGCELVVAVPELADVLPTGPFLGPRIAVAPASPTPRWAGGALAVGSESPDLLLSLTTLDPAVGADHLASWTSDVAVVVTAGRSGATTIRAVGEMIRAAGLRLAFGVLMRADKHDESLGYARSGAGWRQPSRV